MMADAACVLAFDFGLARVGVAQGNTLVGIAHPITTIHHDKNEVLFKAITQLISEWHPQQLVVGLPFHTDGTEHELTKRCRRFARQLFGRFQLPVFLIDERLSSIIAETMLKEAHVFGKKQKQYLDQVAAAAILQSYFDGNALEKITKRAEKK